MTNLPTQPGQRNIASHGDYNVNITGDNATINIHPPLPPPSPRHQLRAPVSDFKGRETEIATLLAALAHDGQANMAGISGLGGVGKTELAYVVAAHLAAHYPDAQLVLDRRGTDAVPRLPAEALAECVRAFAGVEVRLPPSLLEDEAALMRLYRDYLTKQKALVLLDNAVNDEQALPFLPPPGSALLVTSRETLHLPGLRTRVQLDELPPDKARELLQGMTSTECVPPRIDDAVADQICALCGYLPLAVRAAGGLLDVTPDLEAADYAAELRDTRARLALRYTNAEGRALSVEASFQLSYQHLPDEMARVFCALAVFPADFDGAAVEAIAADEGRKHLRKLLRRNLVRYNAETKRYRLHDLARVFAEAQASEAERAAWQAEHARYFCELLRKTEERYLNAQVRAGLALYDLERTNIAVGQAWAANGAKADEVAARLCMEYPYVGAHVLELRLHPRERVQWLEAQLAAARQPKRQEMEVAALGNLGVAYASLGELPRALECFKQALAIDREIGDRRGEANALGNLGLAYANLGELRSAIGFYEQDLAIRREIGDRRGEGGVLGNLGSAYADLGELPRAVEFYEQSLMIQGEIGDRRGEGTNLGNLGVAYANLGKLHGAVEFFKQSIECFKQALEIAREIGDRDSEANARWNQALVCEQLGDRAQAISYAEAAVLILEAIEHPGREMVRKQLAIWRQ